jgi:hypothetical protein
LRKVTGLFPARHSRPSRVPAHLTSQRRSRPRGKDFPPIRMGSSPAPKSQEVVP